MVIASLGYEIVSVQKYVSENRIAKEYSLLIIILLFFGLAVISKHPLNILTGYLGAFLLLRFCLICFFDADKRETEQAVKDAVRDIKSNMNAQIAYMQSQLEFSITDKEIQQKVEAMRGMLLAQEQQHIEQIESRYAKLLESAGGKSNEAEKLKEILAKKDAEIIKLQNSVNPAVEDAVSHYKMELEKKNQELLERDRMIAQKENVIEQKNTRLREAETKLSQSKQQIKNDRAIIAKKDRRIKELENLHAEQDDYIKSLEMQSKEANVMIHNEEIHDKLIEVLTTARKEVDIMSPWISYPVINPIKKMIGLLVKRGVTVKFIYGIENSHDSVGQSDIKEKNDSKQIRAEKIIHELRSAYGGKYIKAKYFSSHSKLIICDDSYYVITSCNPLSNKGDCWEEIGEISENQENLQAYRKKYFNF